MKTLIKGGRVIDPSQGISDQRDVLIEDERIKAILEPGSSADHDEVFDASGKWVVPGLIDMHVHLREPGEEYKETIASGSSAAVAGGVSAVACMANTRTVNDNASVTDYIRDRARAADKARIYPVGAVTRGLAGEELAEMGELVGAGCVALSDDGHPITSDLIMRHALEYCLGLGVPLLSHPEQTSLSEGGCMNESHVSTELGLAGVPGAAEEVMVARDVLMAELTGGRLHLQHLSTEGSVRIVRRAKERGVRVTAETCPHYFTLTDEAVRGYDSRFKMNPPLRSEEDRLAIIAGLADGTIDAVASDHAPHSSVEKDVEFAMAANGIVGLETILPLSLSLVREGHLSPSRWVELVSAAPAEILGVEGGSLAPGQIADVTVLDPEEEWIVEASKFYSKGRYTPFQGWKVKGKAKAVFVGGALKTP